MKRCIHFTLLAALGVEAVLLLVGCEGNGGHKMATVSSDAEHPVMCKACYDQIATIRKAATKQEWQRNRLIRRHHCPDCKTDMTFYTQEGVPMVKCAKCAPEGVACDKCVPSKAKH